LKIDNIDAISACTSLETLELKFNSAVPCSLNKLSELTKLKRIRFGGSFFSEVNFIQKLKLLQEINLSKNSIITDFTLPEHVNDLKILRVNNLNELRHIHESKISGDLAMFSIKYYLCHYVFFSSIYKHLCYFLVSL
jgi:hypothetical protein